MKFVLASLIAVMSSNASAAIQFFAKIENQECKLVDNKVEKVVSFMKGELTLKQSANVEVTGIEALAARAATAATNVAQEPSFHHYMILENGERVNLNSQDSKEAMAILRLLSAACKFQF